MVNGGVLYVYVDNGSLCERPAKIGSGVIVGGTVERLSVSSGTVSFLRKWTQWCPENKAAVLQPAKRDTARMIGDGRDVVTI